MPFGVWQTYLSSNDLIWNKKFPFTFWDQCHVKTSQPENAVPYEYIVYHIWCQINVNDRLSLQNQSVCNKQKMGDPYFVFNHM